MTNYKTQRISTIRDGSPLQARALSVSYPRNTDPMFSIKSCVALLITLCLLVASLSIAHADDSGTANHCHTVLLSGTDVKDLPGSITVGDEITWSNLSNRTIVIERNSGFHLFLPSIMVGENKLSSTEPLVEMGKNNDTNLLGEPASAWIIEAGESVTMDFDQPNYYIFKIDGEASQQWQVVVNIQ